LEKDYAEDEEEDDEEEEEGAGSDDEAPVLITSREDFDAMMDDFLDNYEIVGRKMRPVLEGEDAAAKFATFRAAISEGGIRLREGADEDDDQIPMPVDVDDIKDKWDCETILSVSRLSFCGIHMANSSQARIPI
jgi:protein LTV1